MTKRNEMCSRMRNERFSFLFGGSGGGGAAVKCPQPFGIMTIWPFLQVEVAAAKYCCGFDVRATSICVAGVAPETCVTVVIVLRGLFWMALIFRGVQYFVRVILKRPRTS